MSSHHAHYDRALKTAFRINPGDTHLSDRFNALIERMAQADSPATDQSWNRSHAVGGDDVQSIPMSPTWRSNSS
jgi:hypothetical protein